LLRADRARTLNLRYLHRGNGDRRRHGPPAPPGGGSQDECGGDGGGRGGHPEGSPPCHATSGRLFVARDPRRSLCVVAQDALEPLGRRIWIARSIPQIFVVAVAHHSSSICKLSRKSFMPR